MLSRDMKGKCTGQAGREGGAWSLVTGAEMQILVSVHS